MLSTQMLHGDGPAAMEDRLQALCCTRVRDVHSITEYNARISSSCPTLKFNMREAPQRSRKGVDSSNDLYNQVDSSETSDVLEEGEESRMMLKMHASKNLVSERKRRKKMNERLYSLRALVPNISKMDKASIVSDAVHYLKNLQSQVDKIQVDIVDLETHKKGPVVVSGGDEDPRRNNSAVSFDKRIKPEHQILELEVSQMEERIYQLRIHCKKTPGVLVQLTRALEALELEILNANISSVDDHILNSVVVEVKKGMVMKTEELRNMALAVVPKFGFSFCGKRCS